MDFQTVFRREGRIVKKSKSYDNRGLTLVELIIGVTILAIIIVPLLSVFVTGAATSLKSRTYSEATEAAQNLVEQIQSCKTDTLLSDSAELYSGAKYYTPHIDAHGTTSYTLYGTTAPTSTDNKFYIGIHNVSSGATGYDALITLDASSTKNDAAVSVSNQMDTLLGMTDADDTALSVLRTQFGSDSVSPASLTLDDMNRSITVNVTKDAKTNFYDIDVEFEYLGKASSIASGFEYTASSSSRISVADAVPSGKPIFSVYMLFNAYYSGTDTITINNLAGGDFNVFLVDTTDNPAVPSGYSATILYRSQYDNSVPRVFTNIDIDPKTIVYHAFDYYHPDFYKSLKPSGYLVETKAKSREFSVNVSLFKSGGGFVGSPVVSIASNKLD